MLFETGIKFDSNIPNEVCQYFVQNAIDIDKRQIFLQIAAVAAILSENKLMAIKNITENTPNDTTIEAVMSNLNGVSKE